MALSKIRRIHFNLAWRKKLPILASSELPRYKLAILLVPIIPPLRFSEQNLTPYASLLVIEAWIETTIRHNIGQRTGNNEQPQLGEQRVSNFAKLLAKPV